MSRFCAGDCFLFALELFIDDILESMHQRHRYFSKCTTVRDEPLIWLVRFGSASIDREFYLLVSCIWK